MSFSSSSSLSSTKFPKSLFSFMFQGCGNSTFRSSFSTAAATSLIAWIVSLYFFSFCHLHAPHPLVFFCRFPSFHLSARCAFFSLSSSFSFSVSLVFWLYLSFSFWLSLIALIRCKIVMTREAEWERKKRTWVRKWTLMMTKIRNKTAVSNWDEEGKRGWQKQKESKIRQERSRTASSKIKDKDGTERIRTEQDR